MEVWNLPDTCIGPTPHPESSGADETQAELDTYVAGDSSKFNQGEVYFHIVDDVMGADGDERGRTEFSAANPKQPAVLKPMPARGAPPFAMTAVRIFEMEHKGHNLTEF